MAPGTLTAFRAGLRGRVMAAMLILFAAGLASAVPGPSAKAGAAMADHGRRPGQGGPPVTAYVANFGSGTVTPIATATNTAGPPITVGSEPVGHRDHAGRQDRLRHQLRLGHGDPDRDRHQHRRPADHGRQQPRCHRDHAGRQDRLRRQLLARGHGDPDRDRHQHRRAADHGRQRPLCHRDHAGRQDRLRRQLRLGAR